MNLSVMYRCAVGIVAWFGLGFLQVMAEVPSREDVTVITATGKVFEIDYKSRELTVLGPDGHLKHVVVGEHVERLSEVEKGDDIKVSFFVSDLYEVREPTPEEVQAPQTELDHVIKASSKHLPAGASLKQFRSVCTIVDLNSVNMTGTLKDPNGKFRVVAIKNPENITKLRIGQTVVVVHTEALAVSLEKTDMASVKSEPALSL